MWFIKTAWAWSLTLVLVCVLIIGIVYHNKSVFGLLYSGNALSQREPSAGTNLIRVPKLVAIDKVSNHIERHIGWVSLQNQQGALAWVDIKDGGSLLASFQSAVDHIRGYVFNASQQWSLSSVDAYPDIALNDECRAGALIHDRHFYLEGRLSQAAIVIKQIGQWLYVTYPHLRSMLSI